MSEKTVLQTGTQPDQEAMIIKFHEHLTQQYPGLNLRWSRLYGKRWSHFLGGKSEVAFFALKIELNRQYGVCIENPEILAEIELGRVINMLREAFREAGS